MIDFYYKFIIKIVIFCNFESSSHNLAAPLTQIPLVLRLLMIQLIFIFYFYLKAFTQNSDLNKSNSVISKVLYLILLLLLRKFHFS